MIGFLRGKVHYIGKDYVLLDVNNVGYHINFNNVSKLNLNEEVLIYTYQNVREDELSLFGFLTIEEYELFVKLIGVKGLGPKIASGILAAASLSSIIDAIESGNVAFMKSMPGVGNKTASQIILDLKGKLVESNNEVISDELKDVEQALKSLGYKQNEIKPILKELNYKNLTTEEYLKEALKLLKK